MQPAPVATSERIGSLDALRGFALLGILLMNIPFFGLPYQTAEDLTIRGVPRGGTVISGADL